MGLFMWRGPARRSLGEGGPERPASSGEPVVRPTFFQQLTGTGEYMKQLGKARKGVTKKYFQQKRRFTQDKRQRIKDFAKDLEKQRERYFRRAGLSDLAGREPTSEEMANSHIRFYVKEQEEHEKYARLNFDRSERRVLNDMRQDYHKQLRETSAQIRQRGPAAFQTPSSSSIGPLQHFLGRSSRPDNGRRT